MKYTYKAPKAIPPPEVTHEVTLEMQVGRVLVVVDGYYILEIGREGVKRIGCVDKTVLPCDSQGRVLID
jgi:hypothetical protein